LICCEFEYACIALKLAHALHGQKQISLEIGFGQSRKERLACMSIVALQSYTESRRQLLGERAIDTCE
jgi:hypothetical protein